jgi:hypothetical protein
MATLLKRSVRKYVKLFLNPKPPVCDLDQVQKKVHVI